MNVLLLVNNSASLFTTDTWIRDRLVALGHTVTLRAASAAAPDLSTTNLIVFARSATLGALGTKYDATALGVLSLGAKPHSGASSEGDAANGVAQQTEYVVAANGDAIVGSNNGQAVTVLAGNTVTYTYFTDTYLGAGVTLLTAATANFPGRILGFRYESGTAMQTGTAPGRRCRLDLMNVALVNATGQTWFDNAVAWAAGGNQPPVANAGPDQGSVTTGSTVTLDGTGSSDVDGTIAAYSWRQVSGPTVALSSTTAAQPTFTAPGSAATLVFGLIVTDNGGKVSGEDLVTITVAAGLTPPTSDAGPDQVVRAGSTVTLDSSASSGTITARTWRQISGTAVSLSSTSATSPTFTAPASLNGATLVFGVRAQNGTALGAEDTVTVRALPTAYKNRRSSGAWARKALKTRVAGAWQ